MLTLSNTGQSPAHFNAFITRLLGWLRQGGVALVGYIAVTVGVHMDSGGSYAATIDKSKSSRVALFKAVVIDNGALNPEAELATLNAA